MFRTSPIVTKELRPLLRSGKAFWLMLLALVVLGGVFWAYWIDQMGHVTVSTAARRGRELFIVLSIVQLCALGLISPLITATAVTAEREAGTLDLLLATGLSRWRILLGKLAASLGYQLLLVACMLPMMVLPFLFGGIGADEIIVSLVLILATVVTYGMLGLAVSCVVRRSLTAMALVLVLVPGLAILLPCALEIMADLDLIGHWRENEYAVFSPIFAIIECADSLMSSARQIRKIGGQLAASPVGSIIFQAKVHYHLFFQAALFLGCWLIAWRRFARRGGERIATAKRLIDDPAVLERRRKKWPYYLIDPLRRPHAIGDGQNPVYVKEQRVGIFSRPQFFLRFCYLCGVVSVLITMELLTDLETVPLPVLALMLLGPLAPLALTQAAGALSREREEKTLDLLRSTLLTPEAIVRAKFLVLMRMLLLLLLSLLALPLVFIVMLWAYGVLILNRQNFWGSNGPFDLLFQIGRALPFVVALAGFYVALGLYCSARARRSITAVVAAFMLACALAGLPYLLGFLDYYARMNSNIRYMAGTTFWGELLAIYNGFPRLMVRLFLELLGPLISPFYWFINEKFIITSSSRWNESWFALGWLLLHAAGVSVLTWALLRRTARRLGRREKT